MVDAAILAMLPIVAAVLGVAVVGIGITTLFARRSRPALVKELWERWFAWVVIAVFFLGGLALGRVAWIALVGVLALLVFREYARAVGLWLDPWFQVVLYVQIVLMHVLAWWPYASDTPGRGWYGLFAVFPAWCTLFLLTVPIVRGRFEHMLQKLALSIVAMLYFGWMLAHVAFLVNLPQGVGLVLFLGFLVAINDVSAFVVGKLIGRHKLRPTLSPGKTWEGAVGALVIVVASGWALQVLVPMYTPLHLVVVSALVSLGGTMGDLALSVIKRDLGIKDWGDAIPGHGGFLDRANSILFAAPIFFHYTRYFFS